MSMIDADKLIEDIRKRNYISKALTEIFETIIDEQPTAYDVDKVVERLEKEKNPNYREDGSLMGERAAIEIDKAIEIVKAGGNIELSEHSKSQGDRTGKQKATVETESKAE